MATVVQSSLDVLLPVLQTRLMAVTGWPAERVVIDRKRNAEDQEAHYQAEQVVFLRSEGRTPNGWFAGMGRVWSPERVRLVCSLWTRVALDEPPGQAIGLTDASRGHEVYANQIKDALTGFFPEDAGGNAIAQQPVEPAGGEGPSETAKFDRTWTKSTLAFALTFAPTLAQSYQ